MIRTNDLKQLATYWRPGSPDGSGSYDYSKVLPVVIRCRWQDTQVLFTDAAGRSVRSAHTVYVDRPLLMDGYLMLGTPDDFSVSPIDLPDARIILQVYTTVSLNGRAKLVKALL